MGGHTGDEFYEEEENVYGEQERYARRTRQLGHGESRRRNHA